MSMAIVKATPAVSRLRLASFFIVAVLFVFSASANWAQSGMPDRSGTLGGQGSPVQHQSMDDPGGGTGYFDSVMGQHRLKMLNDERHKAIVTDSDKLLKLAADLNDEIAHSNPGSLTPEQLRKIAEIEKLAHNVRDKMTMTIGAPTPNYLTPYGSPFGPQ